MAFIRNAVLMQLHQKFADGKTQARPLLRPGRRAIKPLEWLERAWNIGSGNAFAVIPDFKDKVVVTCQRGRKRNRAALYD